MTDAAPAENKPEGNSEAEQPPQTAPEKIPMSLRGFDTEEHARAFADILGSYVRSISRYIDLATLDGVPPSSGRNTRPMTHCSRSTRLCPATRASRSPRPSAMIALNCRQAVAFTPSALGRRVARESSSVSARLPAISTSAPNSIVTPLSTTSSAVPDRPQSRSSHRPAWPWYRLPTTSRCHPRFRPITKMYHLRH